MNTNRLKLDFTLNTQEERANFLNTYLQQESFITHPPNEQELEKMGDYVLWGKESADGLNGKQSGKYLLSTKHKTWDNDAAFTTESLDELQESPTFNEGTLHHINDTPIKLRKEVFSRTQALTQCPPDLVPKFTELFAAIDQLDLELNLYDLAHGKRVNPIRPELINKFTPEQVAEATEKTTKWTQFFYLKQRHLLVELRRQQYTLRDTYTTPIIATNKLLTPAPVFAEFDEDIEILPLGTHVKDDTTAAAEISNLIFKEWYELDPESYTEDQLKQIYDLYWQKQNYTPKQYSYLDLRDTDHIYQLLEWYYELADDALDTRLESGCARLIWTLEFYMRQADLTDCQREILTLKMKKVKNEDIRGIVNRKYGKNYTINYISTIYTQKIVPKIADAAKYHELVVSNLAYPEEFKRCTGCGKLYLRDPINFTRKNRSADGFVARCKKCEKAARQANK